MPKRRKPPADRPEPRAPMTAPQIAIAAFGLSLIQAKTTAPMSTRRWRCSRSKASRHWPEKIRRASTICSAASPFTPAQRRGLNLDFGHNWRSAIRRKADKLETQWL
jgi:hypothetical protein